MAMRIAGILGIILMAGQATAADVPVETATLGKAEVTLHVHPFLSDEELVALRLVLTNEDALALFVPGKGGHAALAVSPDDGFIRDGALVKSAVALAEMADAAAASVGALTACEAAKAGKAACVVVLNVAPK
jgi:hypothetical protein